MGITITKPATEERVPNLTAGNGHGDFARRSPLQPVWDELAYCGALGGVAEIHAGIHFKPGLAAQCVSAEPQPDYAPGIQTVGDYLEAYLVADYQYLCTKPDVMSDHAHQLPWDRPKVIANSALLSRGIWSIAGAADYQGVRPTQQFYGLWPKKDMPVEVLAAIISGPVANAYLFGCPPAGYNQIRWIKQIPVPPFTQEQMELIASLAQDYISYRGQWIAEPRREEFLKPKCLELLYQIDAAVLEAYALPSELERELLHHFDGEKRRPVPFKFPGYGEDYHQAKQKLQEEKAFRLTLKLYHVLVDKKFLTGLNETENAEMERLGLELDAANAPFYEGLFAHAKKA